MASAKVNKRQASLTAMILQPSIWRRRQTTETSSVRDGPVAATMQRAQPSRCSFVLRRGAAHLVCSTWLLVLLRLVVDDLADPRAQTALRQVVRHIVWHDVFARRERHKDRKSTRLNS